jgi:Phage Mu protein F like protein
MPNYTFNPTPPREALAFFRAKAIKPGFDYRDVWREEHATAFTVAKAMQVDVLEGIRDELDRALAEGRTFASFKRDLTPTLQKLGWWGKQEQTDPLTGEVRDVQLGSPRRLKTIYQVNMRTARAAGQVQRAERTKRSHPYFLYELGPSKEHREEHVQWRGLMLPIDHPFWKTHMPTNGYGCKCRVRQVNKREYERLAANDRYITESPEIKTREWKNKRTGEVSQVPEGIDPGFDINPGQVARTEHAASVFGTKIKTARPEVGSFAMRNAAEFVQSGIQNNYRSWVAPLYRRERQGQGETQLLAAVTGKTIKGIRARGIEIDTAAITLQDKQVRHLARPNKHAREHSLSETEISLLAKHLVKPKAVLLDAKAQTLIYLVKLSDGSYGKAVVSIGHRNKAHLDGQRERIQTNDIRTASTVQLDDIQGDVKGGVLELLEGKITK